MKLVTAALGNKRKPVKTAKGPRYQVRWYINFGSGIVKERKETSFLSVGEAELFIGQLRMADFEAKGWYFAPGGRPSNLPKTTDRVVTAVDQYFTMKWSANWGDNQRRKVIGRFAFLVAFTLEQRRDREALYQAFAEQQKSRGPRPQPLTKAQWAGRWLRDYAFYPNKPEPTDPDVLRGRDWVHSRSLSLNALDRTVVVELRNRMTAGIATSSQRTYWESVIVPFLTWLADSGLVERSPLVGVSKRQVSQVSKRADPRRIPNPSQVEEIAAKMKTAHGGNWDIFVLLGAFCALRVGETLGVRTNSFYRRSDGRLMLNVDAQEKRVAAECNDAGLTRVRTSPKSITGHDPLSRQVPVPLGLAELLARRFGNDLCKGSHYLFVGPRGAVGNYDTVRQWWNEAIVRQFPESHPLAGITTHAMRHAGMTWWFAARYDEAHIQKWGGWRSLKVMLDVYRGVLEDIDSVSLDGLDRFEADWVAKSASHVFESHGKRAEVVDLNAWRLRVGAR